jgi:hypothetical protein
VQVWTGAPIYFLAASSVFNVPLWRHVMAWLGGRPATLGHFRRLLRRGSVAVIVGGIAEMYLQVWRRSWLLQLPRLGPARVPAAGRVGLPAGPTAHACWLRREG